jgi:ABC-2 type transport system permease protein
MMMGYPQLEMVFSLLAIPVAILIPIFGCTAFTSDRKNNTDSFLLMLPVSKLSVFFGKLLARAAVMALPCIVMLVYPVILDLYGDVNYVSSYLVFAMFILFEIFILVMSMLFSAMAKNSLIAYSITFGVLLVTWLIPYIPGWTVGIVSESFAEVLSGVCVFLSPFAQFDYFNVGIFDFRKVIWLAVFSLMMAVLSYVQFCRKAKKI